MCQTGTRGTTSCLTSWRSTRPQPISRTSTRSRRATRARPPSCARRPRRRRWPSRRSRSRRAGRPPTRDGSSGPSARPTWPRSSPSTVSRSSGAASRSRSPSRPLASSGCRSACTETSPPTSRSPSAGSRGGDARGSPHLQDPPAQSGGGAGRARRHPARTREPPQGRRAAPALRLLQGGPPEDLRHHDRALRAERPGGPPHAVGGAPSPERPRRRRWPRGPGRARGGGRHLRPPPRLRRGRPGQGAPAGDVEKLLDDAERLIFQTSERRLQGAALPVRSILKDTFEHIERLYERKEHITGLASGFDDLDRLTSGFQSSDFIIIAGRPSMGKTAFAMNVAKYAGVEHHKTVLVLRLEMTKEQLVQRLLCAEARVDSHKVRTGYLDPRDWTRLTHAAGRLAE